MMAGCLSRPCAPSPTCWKCPISACYEVATFYTMFQLQPVGKKAHVQVCGTTPCMLRGANELKDVCRRKIARIICLSEDGNFSWEEMECLGACVNAPMVQIFKDTYEDLTPETLEQLIDDIAAGRSRRARRTVGISLCLKAV
jgi:NADH-quinone oxidoreductase subunit E